MAAAAGDRRQVTRSRREERQRQPLAVADAQLAAGGMGLDRLFVRRRSAHNQQTPPPARYRRPTSGKIVPCQAGGLTVSGS